MQPKVKSCVFYSGGFCVTKKQSCVGDSCPDFRPFHNIFEDTDAHDEEQRIQQEDSLANHKGQPCLYEPITCQEGYCEACNLRPKSL